MDMEGPAHDAETVPCPVGKSTLLTLNSLDGCLACTAILLVALPNCGVACTAAPLPLLCNMFTCLHAADQWAAHSGEGTEVHSTSLPATHQ